MITSFWEDSREATLLFSLVALAVSLFLFLVGPYDVAQRIRLRLAPALTQPIRKSGNLVIETDIPARLDRLPWSSFHTLVAAGLGVTWILNGLEVTLAGAFSPAFTQSPVLRLTEPQVGFANTAYLSGLVVGALLFGWATDHLGRKRLFFVTLLVYLVFTALTGAAWNLESLALFRFLTGAGIGGEYAAINSTIQELIPAKFRGRTDLLISGTFWIGAGIGAMGSTVLLDPTIINPEFGWRIAFLIGALLALVVLRIRRAIPESPRWLMTHQRLEEANAIVSGIEEKCGVHLDPNERLPHVHLIGRESTPLLEVVQTLFCVYPRRALVSFSLMAAQALVYNAIFFTYSQALTHFFNIPPEGAGYYFLFFAAGNFLGPLVLGRLFDTFGRKRMIAGTYAASGVLLAISGYLFMIGAISGALAQALFWMVTFFFASAAASAAYLTAGEIFPLEIRALAIAFFFAVGTALGGVISPWLFSSLVAQGPERFYSGYLVLSAAMMAAAAVAALWGVPAERKSLEEIARPLTFVQ